MRRRSVIAIVVTALAFLAPSSALAQDPPQQPLVQQGDMTHLYSFEVPYDDGQNLPNAQSSLDYSPRGPLGIGADGTSLYYACHDWSNKIARVTIPTQSGTSAIVEQCASVPQLNAINPNDPNDQVIGGALAWNGRVVMSAYAYYDANGTAVASHFVSASNLAGLTGPPFALTTTPGFVGGWMTPIPPEWRPLLGGPALTGLGAIPIISRSSHGPSVTVFDPANVGVLSPTPSTMVLGYPQAEYNPAVGHYNAPGPIFDGATRIGGLAFPPETRSLLAVERHPTMPTNYCYGEGTSDQSLHGQPVPGTDGAVIYCYDPTNHSKGTHGFPYRHLVAAYDANDLLAVKQGTKQPWEPSPYATWDLTEMGSGGFASMQGAVFDPATNRWYIGAGGRTIHVYQVAISPLLIEVCGDGIDNDADGLTDEDCVEVCGDGIDNDGDGLTDEDCVEVCGDGIDNDGDGLTDEDCAAPGPVPDAPQRTAATVNRSTVRLKWRAPSTGADVDYVVEAGVAPGQTTFATPVGNVTSVSVPNVGTGTYYVRVRARNQNGESAASNEVVVSVGCTGRSPRLKDRSAAGSAEFSWTDPDGCSGTN